MDTQHREERGKEVSNAQVEESAKAAADIFQAADPVLVRSMFELIRLLVEEAGPVPAEKVASRLQLSHDEAATILQELRVRGAEFDEEGNFVGMGLTLVPTPHRYETNGRTFYTWCADDAIIFPAMFGQTAIIESPDPISGEYIRLTVTPEGVQRVEPTTAVVSRRFMGGTFHDVRGTVCNYGHLFASPETASEYAARHTGAGFEVSTADEAFRIGQLMLEQEPLKSVFGR
jgi:alkylmercury lyase